MTTPSSSGNRQLVDAAQLRKITSSFDLSSVFSLNLRERGLLRVPTAVAQCTSLQTLDLQGNALPSLGSLPAELTDLRTLNLSANRIFTLDDMPVFPRLERLYLHGNPIKKLEALYVLSRKAPKLVELSLSGPEGKGACPVCEDPSYTPQRVATMVTAGRRNGRLYILDGQEVTSLERLQTTERSLEEEMKTMQEGLSTGAATTLSRVREIGESLSHRAVPLELDKTPVGELLEETDIKVPARLDTRSVSQWVAPKLQAVESQLQRLEDESLAFDKILATPLETLAAITTPASDSGTPALESHGHESDPRSNSKYQGRTRTSQSRVKSGTWRKLRKQRSHSSTTGR